MIRVLLVDDHPVVRAGYARLLEQTGDISVVAEASNAEQGYALAQADPLPEVIVADLSMPGAGGLDLIRRVLARDARARILVFSMHDSEPLVRRAFEAGALGFVSKSSAPEMLVQAVRAVHAGRRLVSPDLAPLLASPAQTSDGLLSQLTEREFVLFRLLAEGRSLAECARALKLSVKTVSNYQSTIRDKLGVGTSAALAHLAIRTGVIKSSGQAL